MAREAIHFFAEDVAAPRFSKKVVRNWLTECAKHHSFSIKNINYIFCSDEYLLEINKQYLEHDYYTDIITFDQSEEASKIEGDIFISIDRVKENAETHAVTFEQELMRVFSHGLLHLIGFGDKTKSEAVEMRKQEDYTLEIYKKHIQ